MGRPSSIALIVLILLTPNLYAQEGPQDIILAASRALSPSPAASVKKTKTKRMIPHHPTPFYSMILGVQSWQENIKIQRESDQRSYNAGTELNILAAGAQAQWIKGNWGWQLDGQAFVGQNATQSKDSDLTYYYNHDLIYGLLLNAGPYLQLGSNSVRIATKISALYRHVNYKTPDGFSFGPYINKEIAFLKLEFTFPLANSIELVQQIGFPMDSEQVTWYFGLRL